MYIKIEHQFINASFVQEGEAWDQKPVGNARTDNNLYLHMMLKP